MCPNNGTRMQNTLFVPWLFVYVLCSRSAPYPLPPFFLRSLTRNILVFAKCVFSLLFRYIETMLLFLLFSFLIRSPLEQIVFFLPTVQLPLLYKVIILSHPSVCPYFVKTILLRFITDIVLLFQYFVSFQDQVLLYGNSRMYCQTQWQLKLKLIYQGPDVCKNTRNPLSKEIFASFTTLSHRHHLLCKLLCQLVCELLRDCDFYRLPPLPHPLTCHLVLHFMIHLLVHLLLLFCILLLLCVLLCLLLCLLLCIFIAFSSSFSLPLLIFLLGLVFDLILHLHFFLLAS